jgi:hypothetical protein
LSDASIWAHTGFFISFILGESKMKQYVLICVLFFGLAVSVFGQIASAFQGIDEGNGTITITGYRGTVKDVIIPEKINGLTVGAIGKNAFYDKQLTGVIIPDGVTSIRAAAFSNNKLSSVTIGANVSIDSWAFSGSFITAYNKGGKKAGTYVRQAGRYALQAEMDARRQEGVSVSGQIASAFQGIDEGNGTITITGYKGMLKDVIIPEKTNGLTVGAIGKNAFYDKQLTGVTIQDSVTSIGEEAFFNNRLSSITIGADVSIGPRAFPGTFKTVYNNGGKKAGTYVRRAGTYVNLTNPQTGETSVASKPGRQTNKTSDDSRPGRQTDKTPAVPQLGEPTIIQQGLNRLPAVPIGGKNLKFEFGGDTWMAKINGQNFLAGDCIFEKKGNGYLLSLKTTNIWSGGVDEVIDLFQKIGVPLGPAAGPLRTAARLTGKVAKWIPLKGASINLEYNEDSPTSLRLGSR